MPNWRARWARDSIDAAAVASDTEAGSDPTVTTTTTTIDFIVNAQRLAKSGFPLFKTTGRGTYTWTNPAIGKSVSFFSPVPART
jgi:hypothetical protein